jgi:hypothetical protein
MTNTDLRAYMTNELAKIQIATDTFFKMLGDLNVLAGAIEGDFIPVVSGLTTAGVGTYTLQQGRFLKIGRLVAFMLRVDWSAHTGTGGISITGLPSPSMATGGMRAVCLLEPFTAATPNTDFTWIPPSTARLEVIQANNAGARNMVAAHSLSVTGLYFTD